MTQDNNNLEDKNSKMISTFYIALSIIAVIVMIIAAFITHGYDAKEIKVSFYKVFAQDKNSTNIQKQNKMSVSADTSKVPSDYDIEKILNDTIPNVCDDITDDKDIKKKCDKKPLSCLKEYEINKVFIQNSGYEDQLYIELLTGKTQQDKYTVVIDLNTYEVISADGKIDDKRCRDVEEDDNGNENDPLLKEGADPSNSDYINTKPRE